MAKIKDSKQLFLTTPIYYVNAKPHLGHAYTTIVGDFLKKYALMRGKDVYYQTGTDEHGEKIVKKANEEGVEPKKFADAIAAEFEEAWKKLSLEPDCFYRTTTPEHYKMVQNALQYLKDKGDIYFAEYEGKYCVGCERFRTENEWNEEGLCPDHLTKADVRKEPNYFFKMGSYQEKLLEYYKNNPESIRPNQYMQEVLSFLKQPLEDLNISRPVERLTWGIPLPFDDKYVTYVWFDALLNYLGGIGYDGNEPGKNPNFKEDFWANSTHLLGKDILKTHAVYWPTMLMGLGLEPFRDMQVGGFWLSKGIKMSKSLGNVVDPLKVSEHFGVDVFRYFLLREMSFGSDASFTWEAFVTRCNAELANGIGNLASRVITIVHKRFDAKIPEAVNEEDIDKELLATARDLPALMAREFDDCRYHIGLKAFSDCIASCDRYINETKPWVLAKDECQKERLGTVLRTALEVLHILSVVSYPVTPIAAKNLQNALGQEIEINGAWSRAVEGLDATKAMGEKPKLFPRLELPD